MEKWARIILKPSFVLIVSIVVVYALFLSAIFQLYKERSQKATSYPVAQQVLGETTTPTPFQTPTGLMARNQRCTSQGTVDVDLFWKQSSQALGYWLAVFVDGRWQMKWIALKVPTSDGLVSISWTGLKPRQIYYWTVIAWQKSSYSPWAPIQYFQTVNCLTTINPKGVNEKD